MRDGGEPITGSKFTDHGVKVHRLSKCVRNEAILVEGVMIDRGGRARVSLQWSVSCERVDLVELWVYVE